MKSKMEFYSEGRSSHLLVGVPFSPGGVCFAVSLLEVLPFRVQLRGRRQDESGAAESEEESQSGAHRGGDGMELCLQICILQELDKSKLKSRNRKCDCRLENGFHNECLQYTEYRNGIRSTKGIQ